MIASYLPPSLLCIALVWMLGSRIYSSLVKGGAEPADSIGEGAMYAGSKQSAAKRNLRRYTRVLLSVVLLGASIYIILSDTYDDAQEKWAFGTIGSLLGYWLKK